MNVPKVSCRVVLLLAAVLCAAAEKTDMKEESVKKSAITQNQSSVIAILKKLEARVEKLEAKRIGFFRGRDGRDGIPGKPGIPGRDGRDGARGTRGSPGSRGRPGRNGQRGALGPKGDRGPGGVEYVRWGRITCGGNASLVYKGRIGGERYTHNGGAVNYVCLPEIPKYGRYKDGHQIAGYMYGTEYEVRTFNPFTTSNLHDHEAPCAVCYVQTRSAKLMIPATYECPAGWTREYHGYLMTEYHNHAHPREFICVDQGAEAVPGTHANVDGALLYPVEGVCGSLPCQPYVEGRQLTCTVCTK